MTSQVANRTEYDALLHLIELVKCERDATIMFSLTSNSSPKAEYDRRIAPLKASLIEASGIDEDSATPAGLWEMQAIAQAMKPYLAAL